MKVVLYCEGESELRMVKVMLGPYLRNSEWNGSLIPRNMDNNGHFLRKIGKAVDNSLKIDKVDCVFGLIDLYGTDIPYPSHNLSYPEKAKYLKKYLSELVPTEHRNFFHPHVAVHELEAWLLADETVLSERLGRSINSWPTPENINFDYPPARRLSELFRQHIKKAYRKTVDGERLFQKINPDTVYEKCPHFKMLVDDLKAIGK